MKIPAATRRWSGLSPRGIQRRAASRSPRSSACWGQPGLDALGQGDRGPGGLVPPQHEDQPEGHAPGAQGPPRGQQPEAQPGQRQPRARFRVDGLYGTRHRQGERAARETAEQPGQIIRGGEQPAPAAFRQGPQQFRVGGAHGRGLARGRRDRLGLSPAEGHGVEGELGVLQEREGALGGVGAAFPGLLAVAHQQQHRRLALRYRRDDLRDAAAEARAGRADLAGLHGPQRVPEQAAVLPGRDQGNGVPREEVQAVLDAALRPRPEAVQQDPGGLPAAPAAAVLHQHGPAGVQDDVDGEPGTSGSPQRGSASPSPSPRAR